MTTTARCRVCGGDGLEPVLVIDDVPVMPTVLCPTRADARGIARGSLDLRACPTCALVSNVAFESALVEYSTSYESSQHFSPTFRRYAGALARDLVDRHGLVGGTVVDVGCGKGDLLAIFCELGVGRALGFDPSYDGEVEHAGDGLHIERVPFGPDVDVVADLVVCRHVLEHVEEPVAFLAQIASAVPDGTPIYIEVPDSSFVFGPTGMWDLIYPHVSYFTEPSLRMAFAGAGIAVDSVRPVYGGQFLAAEGRRSATPASLPEAVPVEAVLASARHLGRTYDAEVAAWTALVGSARGVSALWGAGAKGVGFLNAVDPTGDAVPTVIDVNRRKQGGFVPGTGQEVRPPCALAGLGVDCVLFTNPLYETEIRDQLAGLGCRPELRCV